MKRSLWILITVLLSACAVHPAAPTPSGSPTLEEVPTLQTSPTSTPSFARPHEACRDLLLYEWYSPGTYTYQRLYDSQQTRQDITRVSGSVYGEGLWDGSYTSGIPCEIPVGGAYHLFNDQLPNVGDELREGFSCTLENNITHYNEILAGVRGWETINTPLGTMEALRIEGDDLFHVDHTAYSWQETTWWVCGLGLVRQEVRSDISTFNLQLELVDFQP